MSNPPFLSIDALRPIAQALSTTNDLASTLELIASQTTDVLQVDSCSIYLLDPDGTTLRLQASTGLDGNAIGQAILATGQGLTGLAVQENQPIFASHARLDPRFALLPEVQELQFESLLAVPMPLANKVCIGALNVQTRQERLFSDLEIEWLQLLAELAAGAISKARVAEDQQRKLNELNTLLQLSAAVTGPSADEMLQVVVGLAAQLLHASACAIFLLDTEQQMLFLHAAHPPSYAQVARRQIRLGEGIGGVVAAQNKVLASHDVRIDPRYLAADTATQAGLYALLCVPLAVHDRVIGVLHCYHANQHLFSDQEVALLQSLAGQTALALENTRLLTNAAVVREMHHRIKNNLQNVTMLMLLQRADSRDAAVRSALEVNIQRVQSIAAVHEVLSEQGWHLVDVRAVLLKIHQIALQFVPLGEKKIALYIQGEALNLPAKSATSLILAVHELIQNALEHAFVGRSAGWVRVTLSKTRQKLLVSVCDNGVGVTIPPPPSVGLEIVRELIQNDLRGQLVFRPRAEGGTEVLLRMPMTSLLNRRWSS